VHEVSVDLASDRFDVTYDPDLVEVEALLSAIRDLDYEPELVEKPVQERAELERIEVASLPARVQDLLSLSEKSGKPLLLEFSGPG